MENKMKKLTTLMVAGAMMLTASTAFAGPKAWYHVNGTVTAVEPNYVTIEDRQPVNQCSIVEVPILSQKKGNAGESALGGMIIGGILGKAIGGNDKGAAAGAILGGVIGADKAQGGTQEVIGYRQVEKCTTTYQTTTHEVRRGNVIRVEYNGNAMKFFSDKVYNVGDSIPLKMTLTTR